MPDVSLNDRYDLPTGRVLLSGMQALVRLPMLQRDRDERMGLNTAGYISGYRGSPMGSYDLQLERARERLDKRQIRFEPGLNEDLAATAIWGTQQAAFLPGARYDGVFSIWYGKGPGVDRSGDVFKHGNRFGSSEHGGVLLAFGDDHPGKSSTVAHQSDQALAANDIPVLYPANVQELIDYGLLGFELSRYSGLWVGLKCVNETADATGTVELPVDREFHRPPLTPGAELRGGLNLDALGDETRIHQVRLPAARAFARANGIDRVTHGGASARLGIVTAGKSWCDVVAALRLLGIDANTAEAQGISVYKVGMVWPLEEQGLNEFAAGCDELLFVEEKRAFLESQAAHCLFNLDASRRPRLIGKQDADGNVLFSSTESLTPEGIAAVIATRLQRHDAARELTVAADPEPTANHAVLPARTPYFCSGCPHNTSTRVPDGSLAMSGIGCHTMALFMDRETLPPTHMGGEGANWIGISPHSDIDHVFQNLGDGTYNHSGLLAIRAAVVAGVNVTYKILYNDAVAMTGGQTVDGSPTVASIVSQLKAESVKRVAILTSDRPDPIVHQLSGPGISVDPREELGRIQRELRETPGVTALIFDQTCAAEKRRRRKRGLYPDPPKRVLINPEVCEGCGDCSVKSNCVSVVPHETALGRKRRIDQSSCNKDFSCINGFCPSFATIHGGKLRRQVADEPAFDPDSLSLPEPETFAAPDGCCNILVAGIGGTGVVTIGAVLAMAAHLEGRHVSAYDMTGLAQKGGAVQSHLRIAAQDRIDTTARLARGESDLILGCDPMVVTGDDSFPTISPTRTRLLINEHVTPTGQFQLAPDMDFAAERILRTLTDSVPEGRFSAIEATAIAERLLGNAIGANMIMVGYALQKGWLPVSRAAIEKALALNGVALKANLAALAIGRLLVVDPVKVAKPKPVPTPVSQSAQDIVEHRAALLADYQDAALAGRYRQFMADVTGRAQDLGSSGNEFVAAVARNYYKVLAYKDEYEVARLYSADSYQTLLQETFEGDYKVRVHLAPPLLSGPDPTTGEPRKRAFGPWVFPLFRLLTKLRFLRGTRFDPFGYFEERRHERELIGIYTAAIRLACDHLSESSLETACAIADIPASIRGFGPVKARNREAALQRLEALKLQLEEAGGERQAA